MHAEKRELAASILDGTDAAARLDSQALIDLIRVGGAECEEEEDVEEEQGSPSEKSR
jgi:hypothetical protein